MAMLESEMEQRLINQLCHGVSQWIHRPDIKNEEDLWNNIRNKLNKNNISVLDGAPITDGEMEQIKEFIKIISLHKNNEPAIQAEKINALNINW